MVMQLVATHTTQKAMRMQSEAMHIKPLALGTQLSQCVNVPCFVFGCCEFPLAENLWAFNQI